MWRTGGWTWTRPPTSCRCGVPLVSARTRGCSPRSKKTGELALRRSSDEDRAFVANFPYRELVGSLLFIMICTRGDIAYAVHYLARFNSRACKSACLAAKRVLIYLCNTRDRKLRLGGTSRPLLSLFCDTDFAGCLDTRKSMECFLLFFGHCCNM